MLKISKCKAIFSLWPIKRKKTWSGSPQCSSSSLALSSSCWTPALTHCRPQQTSCAGSTPHLINANSVEIVAQQITTWTVAKWCLTQTATHGDTTTLSISLWPMWTQVSKFTVICQAGKPQEEEPSQQSCVWQISSQILSSSTQQRRSCTFLNWQSHWPQILTRETVKRAESMHHLQQTLQVMVAQWIASRWAPLALSQSETIPHYPHCTHLWRKTWRNQNSWAI